MKITALDIENFRNYERETLTWHDKINIICGMNAQGKSNLLEAICYLSLSNSFRGATDNELLAYQQDFFRVGGQIENKGIKSDVQVSYARTKRKTWKIDGQSKNKVSEIIGRFHTIIFSPEDLFLVKSGPDVRRRFFNRQMAQLYPDFYILLLRYNQTLRQRNSLLKKENITEDELGPWNIQLANLAAQVISRRLQTLYLLLPFVSELHHSINEDEQLNIEYKCFLPSERLAQMSVAELSTAYLAQMERLKKAEIARMITLWGPHRDDFEITINGQSARKFASQGQQRSAALALKLAEMELAHAERGYYPVLLLDDVMSELDAMRRQHLLSLMTGKAQTFITATDLNFDLLDGEKYLIENGKVKR